MGTSVFHLPRKPLTAANPRRISAAALKQRPVTPPEPDPAHWEDDWKPNIGEEAVSDVAALGVGAPERPHDGQGNWVDPSMPADVTALSNEELGILHAQMVAMSEWIEWKVALADIDAADEEARLEHVRAEVRLRKSGTVKDKDSKTQNDQRFVQGEVKLLQFQARFKLLRARLRGYDKCASALSREMSRREVELKRLPQ